jgi:hypothetical protein
MAKNPTTPQSAVDRFWDRFIDRARKSGVKEPAIRWHVRRAEQYTKAFAGKRLAEHSVQDVTGYLEGVGRIGRIEDWQFVQVIDAVENLLITAGTPVARGLDWAYWGFRGQYMKHLWSVSCPLDCGPWSRPSFGPRCPWWA